MISYQVALWRGTSRGGCKLRQAAANNNATHVSQTCHKTIYHDMHAQLHKDYLSTCTFPTIALLYKPLRRARNLIVSIALRWPSFLRRPGKMQEQAEVFFAGVR
jgi:hypothetical protein